MINQISAPTPQHFVDMGSIYPTISEPQPYEAPALYELQPNTVETDMTSLQAFQASWMYDQTLTGVFNRITKPNTYNEKWSNTTKQAYWKKMQGLLGGNAKDYKDDYDRMVFSPQDAVWFQRTSMNKQASRAAWNGHTLAALASTVVDPVNFVGWGVGKLPASIKLAQTVNNLSRVPRTLVYGAFGTASGIAATAPNYAYNYDDASNVMIGALLGGSVFSILGAAKGADFANYQKKIFKPTSINENKSFSKAVDSMGMTKEKATFFKKVYSKYLSLADEVQSLFPQFSRSLLALGARGSAQSMRTATSEAGTLYSMIDAQNISKLQENLKKIPGYFADGFWQNVKAGVYGRKSQGLMTKDQIQNYNRQAMGYMATKYNWQTTLDALRMAQQEFMKVAKAVDPKAVKRYRQFDFSQDTINRYALDKHVKSFRQTVNALNKKIPAYNEQMRKQAQETGSTFDQLQPIQFDTSLVNVRNPSIDELAPVSQQIVKAYQDSGVARSLNQVLKEKGRYYTASDNYTHLHIDHYRIDDLAQKQVQNVRRRGQIMLKRLPQQIQRLKTNTADNLLDQVAYKTKLQDLEKQLATWKQIMSSQHSMLMRAYDDLAHDYGYQQYLAISKLHPERFKQTGAQVIGYLNIMRRLRPGAGHLAMKEAWQRCQKRMTDEGMRRIMDDIVAYDDSFLTDITSKMQGQFKLMEYIKAATNERRLHTSSVVGESNLFKRRFREDLMKPGAYTGLRPLDFLNANLYKTAQSMVQETTARASLMGRTLDLKDDAGNLIRTLDLGNPDDLQAAVDALADKARKAGYDDNQRNALADATMNTLLGRPVGEQMSPLLQIFNALGSMSMLKNSAIYQLVEQANLNVEYGHLNVARAMAPAFKMGRSFGQLTKRDDGTLKYMIAKCLAAEGRLRPSVERVGQDVQDIANSAFAQTTQYAAQYTKFLNGGEFVRLWQNNQAAIICQSMFFDALSSGKLQGRLAQMFSPEEFQKFLQNYKTHGTKFKQWDHKSQQLITRAFTEQIGNVVLSMRRGERPRLLMTNTGRWIFAFQSFVWGAHNKLLRRYINNGDYLKLTHLILMQMAGAVGAVYSTQMLKGKDPSQMDPMQVATKLGPSMSALGLIGTLWTSIDRGQIGGTIPALGFATNVGRGVAGITQGNFADMYNTIPLASVFLPLRAVVAALQMMMNE